MHIKAVIFDMDGLLIDSEPLWQSAGMETLASFGKQLSAEQYHLTTGLRTEEWIEYWLRYFDIPLHHAADATEQIIRRAIEKISASGNMMPGVEHAFDFFQKKGIPMGLASSSPMKLIEVVLKKLKIGHHFVHCASAEHLPLGKPHPQVYLDCADAMNVSPVQCIAFEDSFNGMIAAKAARMKCIVVPAAADADHTKWKAADVQLETLLHLNDAAFDALNA